jgi:hypothetical protein
MNTLRDIEVQRDEIDLEMNTLKEEMEELDRLETE